MPHAGTSDNSRGGTAIPKWMLGMLAIFFLILAGTVVVQGEATFLIPVAILALLVGAYTLVNRRLTQRIVKRDGSLEEAMSDADDPIPSAHLFPDSETPLGDTPEAHDEISPHDLPIGHPGRQEAEAQSGSLEGTTGGDVDPSQTGERPR